LRTFPKPILLYFSWAMLLFGVSGVLLAGPFVAVVDAQARLSVNALETEEVAVDERIDASYELSARGGDVFDLSVSSSICGAFGDPDDGDDDGDSELDEDETWIFECRQRYSGATDTITVLANDEDGATVRDFDSRDIAYLDDDADREDEDEGDGERDADDEVEEEEGEGDDKAADSNDGGTPSWLFWGMTGLVVFLVLIMLAFLLWRSRRIEKETERLFL